MKQTIKMIGMALVAVLLSVNFAACSDDDDGTSNEEKIKQELVGNWLQVIEHPGDEQRHLTLRADMTGHIQIIAGGRIDFEKDFTWDVSENTITLSYVGGGSESATFVLDGDTLSMRDGRFIYERDSD